jgi:hypothetical protein
MRTSTILWTTAAVAVPVAGFAAWRERRRAKRHDLDKVGWVNWTLVMVVALVIAASSVGLAMKVHD